MAVEREVNRIICEEHGIDMVYDDTIFWDLQSQELRDAYTSHQITPDSAEFDNCWLIRTYTHVKGGRIIYTPKTV